MLKHLNSSPVSPQRVVVLGSKGFVGSTLLNTLNRKNVACLGLGRQEIDLLNLNASEKLASELQPADALVITSAKAPCKNTEMLADNIQMMKNICAALQNAQLSHVIYVSSDAVYADAPGKLNEDSVTAPDSLHGIMHLARELMLSSVLKDTPFMIVRPSLLFGAQDPHNGYGPNSFYRLAQKGQPIVLFGEGEEQRDHVYIEDVAELIALGLLHRSQGKLNIATGEVHSFNSIANKIVKLFDASVGVQSRPRSGPMPHNGYRAFDISQCRQVFPTFQYTSLDQGLLKMHETYLTV